MPLDQDYVQSMELWLKAFALQIESDEREANAFEESIKLQEQRIELMHQQLGLDKARMNKAVSNFQTYKIDNA